MKDEELKELLEKVENGCVDSNKQLLKWLDLKTEVFIDEDEKEKLINSIKGIGIVSRTEDSPDFEERFNDLIEDFYPETYTLETIAKKNKKIKEFYSKYFNKLTECLDGYDLEFIIFYEAPPHKLDNYILYQSCQSNYKTILKTFFENKEPFQQHITQDEDLDKSFDLDFANLLISNKCLFIDILPLPIKIQSEQRKNWSLNEKTYKLFKISLEKIVHHFTLSEKTQFAIGMPPNSSLGIYNCLPSEKQNFIDLFKNFGDLYYTNFVIGVDCLNDSTFKKENYAEAKFNSHKSNVSNGQSPDLDLLKYAWEEKKSILKIDLFKGICKHMKKLFSFKN
jgi:hypothetical protein